MQDKSSAGLQVKHAGNALRWKTSVSQTLSNPFLDILVKVRLKKPKFLYWLLKTWQPTMEESEGLLRTLTEQMSLEWWMENEPSIREQILDELIRMDNGRGIITDWLALIVRRESLVSVLDIAAGGPGCKFSRFTDQLLDAWCDRSFDDSFTFDTFNQHQIRETALRVMVKATFPSKLAPKTSPEYVDERTWNEERRAKIILKHLSEQVLRADTKDIDTQNMVNKLEILAGWEPSPELHDKKVLSDIFSEWERCMRDISIILTKDDFSTSESNWQAHLRQAYLKTTWKGLIGLSPYCADTFARLLSWMEYWLERGDTVTPEVVEEMARWNPPDDAQREQVAVLWSRYLLSSDGYKNEAVWRAVGRYVAECQKLGSGMEEIVRNCLGALGLVVNTSDGFKKAEVMEAIVCPPRLTKEQQTEWQALWAVLMESSSGGEVGVITRHLLGLVAAGQADLNGVKECILKRLEKMATEKDVNRAVETVGALLDAIGQWDGERNCLEEMFYDVWMRLRQYPAWKEPEIRLKAVEKLKESLKRSLAAGQDTPRLESLWLETLRLEREPVTVLFLQAYQSEIMEICPTFSPTSLEVWKELRRDAGPRIRKAAWWFMVSLKDRLEDETGGLVLEMLGEEKNWDVLCVMAQWKPSPGKSFPAGFREAWADCLQKLAEDVRQSFISGQITNHVLEYRLREIFFVGKSFIMTFVIAWLEEEPGSVVQSAKLADLHAFWKTMNEMFESFSHNAIGKDIRRMGKSMEALFRLTEAPEEFLQFFAEVTEEEMTYEDRKIWKDLLKTIQDREMRLLPVNVRHNLSVVAASMLNLGTFHPEKEMVRSIFLKLYGDGTWDPDRIPAGREEFYRELRRLFTGYEREKRLTAQEMNEICTVVKIGYTIGDGRYHHFCLQNCLQTLGQFLKSTKPEIAAVVENAIWTEVVMAYGTAGRWRGDGKELDWTGQQRWLRELSRNHKEIFDGCEGNGGIREFFNFLWMELKKNTFFQETTGYREGNEVKVLALDSREAVFVHPHRDGNCPAEVPDRLVETGPVGQRARHPSFFFTE